MEAAQRVIVGIDGGATKTVAAAATVKGDLVRAARHPGANVGLEPRGALRSLRAALADVLRDIDRRRVAACVISVSGVDWPEDAAWLARRLGAIAERVEIVNDAFGGLRAALPVGAGVSIICGTGAATAAEGPSGERWFSGHWQLTEGAEELGRAALAAACATHLGIGPPTALSETLPAAAGLEGVSALLRRLTPRGRLWMVGVDRLAPALLVTDQAGDAVACSIITGHGRGLAEIAAAGARSVGLGDSYRLVLGGGVFRHPSSLLADAVVHRFLELGIEPRVSRLTRPPVVGALRMAATLVDGDTLAAVERIEIDPVLYDTTPPSGSNLLEIPNRCHTPLG